jgi:RHS repeat-associated protein
LTSTRQFVWDSPTESDEIKEIRDGSGNVISQLFGYGQTISGSSYYYTRDHLSSVRELSQSNLLAQYNYSSYGQAVKLQGALSADLQFAGYYSHSASGLNLVYHREFDPQIGRWLSRDPMEEEDPTIANYYNYVDNAPTLFRDPTGLVLEDPGNPDPNNPYANPLIPYEAPAEPVNPPMPLCIPSGSHRPAVPRPMQPPQRRPCRIRRCDPPPDLRGSPCESWCRNNCARKLVSMCIWQCMGRGGHRRPGERW